MPKIKMSKEEKEINAKIGSRIFTLRICRDKTMLEVSKAVGITILQLRHYEKGLSQIPATRLLLIAKYLKIDVEMFFKIEDTPLF